MGTESIAGWTDRSGVLGGIEHPYAIGFTDDGERLVAIDHDRCAWVAVLDEGHITALREDLADQEPASERTFGYPTCEGRPVLYSSFEVQDLPLEAPGGWRVERRDPGKDSCNLYLVGPESTDLLSRLGAGWEETFIAGFSPCGRYLALRDFGCLVLLVRDGAF